MMRRALMLALGMLAVPSGAVEVAYRIVDADNFVFRLQNDSALSESAAQAYIQRAAKAVCKEREPQLGLYRIDSNEFVGNEAPERKPVSFVFRQEVKCVASPPSTAQAAPPPPVSAEEKKNAADLVLDRTERYFRLLNEARVDEAFQDLNPDSGVWDEASWKRTKREFQAMAGPLRRINITKVTVYENPKSASEPGLYVAADYKNIWQNVPVQCGYLMRFRTKSGEFRITREVTGHVTAEQYKAMPQAQQQAIEQNLQCR